MNLKLHHALVSGTTGDDWSYRSCRSKQANGYGSQIRFLYHRVVPQFGIAKLVTSLWIIGDLSN